jgi:hypothetical protein
MVQKDLLIQELQKQLHNTENTETKVLLNSLIADVLTGKFNVKVW